jgi:hypothetical protein
MYGWIWRHLPGPFVARFVQAAVLILAVVALLMFVVFPWIEPMLPIDSGGARAGCCCPRDPAVRIEPGS